MNTLDSKLLRHQGEVFNTKTNKQTTLSPTCNLELRHWPIPRCWRYFQMTTCSNAADVPFSTVRSHRICPGDDAGTELCPARSTCGNNEPIKRSLWMDGLYSSTSSVFSTVSLKEQALKKPEKKKEWSKNHSEKQPRKYLGTTLRQQWMLGISCASWKSAMVALLLLLLRSL